MLKAFLDFHHLFSQGIKIFLKSALSPGPKPSIQNHRAQAHDQDTLIELSLQCKKPKNMASQHRLKVGIDFGTTYSGVSWVG